MISEAERGSAANGFLTIITLRPMPVVPRVGGMSVDVLATAGMLVGVAPTAAAAAVAPAALAALGLAAIPLVLFHPVLPGLVLRTPPLDGHCRTDGALPRSPPG